LNTINEKWQDWEGEVLFLHEGTTSHQAFSRNSAYKTIFIENFIGTYGTFAKVRVYKVDGFNLFAKLI
jgi:tRNA A37 methylthiotransferase MiaB